MIFFFDTETTGLSPHSDHVVQLAWAVTDNDGRLINEDCRIIKPSGYEIPWSATRIHGISIEHAQRHGEDLNAVLSRFVADVGQAKLLVAHNILACCRFGGHRDRLIQATPASRSKSIGLR